ncbi:glycosyltransferase family 4 protein [Methyloterricola oryzae]|uniref:glycosyltransferase family 4 protein n=1 Tax=Methyloterricola oryzae TaxID=1495050 RepID=UPI0005EBD410|nr:glycosyltransferase family 4 protein [Methyloterricola oryzae]
MRIVLMTAIYPGKRIGGAEYQTSLLGKELAMRGHEVMYLAVEAGQTAEYQDEGVRVIELPGWGAIGRPAHYQRIREIISDFRPDVGYLRYLLELAGVSDVFRGMQIPLVSVTSSFMETSPLFTGHDPRTMLRSVVNGTLFLHWKAFWSIRHSAVHVCNSEDMSKRIRRWLPGVRIETVYNGSPLPPEHEVHQLPGKQVIWVNNVKRWKRPEQFVELARRLPEFQFVMIGSLQSKGRYAEACRRMLADAPKNLNYLGGLPVEEVNKQIGQSDILVYTSKPDTEGFGNSLLQAWFRAVPTICLSYNVDGIMEREGIGFVTQSMDEFAARVGELMRDSEKRMAMGRKAQEYAHAHHRVGHMVDQYESMFRGIIETSASS